MSSIGDVEMGKKVLVTGAAGSYGSAVCELGKQLGYRMIPTDIRDLPKHDPNFIQCDISDKADVQAKFKDLHPNAVIHCAGIIDVMATELHQKVHLDGTRHLIEQFKGDPELAVFITVSSGAIHGGKDDDIPTVESDERVLKDSYTRTKAEEYDLAMELFKEKMIVIQPALVYDELNRYMFKEIAQMASFGLLVLLPEHGNLKLGLVHPKDLASGTLLLMERGEFGDPLKMRDLVNMVADKCEINPYNPKRSVPASRLKQITESVGRLLDNMPSLRGLEPLGSIMEEMGLGGEEETETEEEEGGMKLPIDTAYLYQHHSFSNAKIKEVTKRRADTYRLLESSKDFFQDGWKPEINPFFEIPRLIDYWIEKGDIKKKATFQDLMEFLIDYVMNMNLF